MREIQINEHTKVPLGWVIGAVLFILTVVTGAVAGSILYIADMRMETRINTVDIKSLSKRQDALENQVRDDIREIKNDLKDLMRSLRNEKVKSDR